MTEPQAGGIPSTQKRITIPVLNAMKKKREPIAALSIYDASFGRIFDEAGGEVIVVGDSAAMVVQGRPNTKAMTMDEMLTFTKAVRRGTKRCFVIGDMPLGSYEISNERAIENAALFMRETDCQAVKVETNLLYLERIEAISHFCPVVLHAGLNPNKADMLGGYRTQGKTLGGVEELVEVARKGEKAGACMILLESVTEEVSQEIRDLVKIPVLGIAAGRKLDGQLLISYDLLDLYEWPGNVTPKHFTAFKAPEAGFTVGGLTLEAFKWFVEAVKRGEFPGEENVHHLPMEHRDEIMQYLQQFRKGALPAGECL
ncbi:MAG: 3-methyl-2-oxobutanoate hydroxymethyltransferase [Candidatus Liptonbacteria bacterium]|nr:3-methyl-2-oxobutanoate hydroxymethyltransferase [Candidatus Liptonbacteria bacterium]